ncbi:hypothetical protein RSC3_02389 [Bacillus paralicheniformis]|nr:hypothetical protein RSC3_02389 [Bacillus paralicheniformis]
MIKHTYPSIGFSELIGECDSFLQTKNRAIQFAASSHPILIHGETGTGKELFAKAIHSGSSFNHDPFTHVSCSTLNEDEATEDFFLSEMNESGTLFLDEVWGLSLPLQGKLLAAIEKGMPKRLIVTSSVPLGERIESREFRKDLYYRLNVLDLPLPPLLNGEATSPFSCIIF